MNASDLKTLDQLFEAYGKNASVNMQKAIRLVRNDLVDPEVQQALGLMVSHEKPIRDIKY